MTHEETTALVRRANASGFDTVADYAVDLEKAIRWYVNERERYFRGEPTASLDHAFERLRSLSKEAA